MIEPAQYSIARCLGFGDVYEVELYYGITREELFKFEEHDNTLYYSIAKHYRYFVTPSKNFPFTIKIYSREEMENVGDIVYDWLKANSEILQPKKQDIHTL